MVIYCQPHNHYTISVNHAPRIARLTYRVGNRLIYWNVVFTAQWTCLALRIEKPLYVDTPGNYFGYIGLPQKYSFF